MKGNSDDERMLTYQAKYTSEFTSLKNGKRKHKLLSKREQGTKSRKLDMNSLVVFKSITNLKLTKESVGKNNK